MELWTGQILDIDLWCWCRLLHFFPPWLVSSQTWTLYRKILNGWNLSQVLENWHLHLEGWNWSLKGWKVSLNQELHLLILLTLNLQELVQRFHHDLHVLPISSSNGMESGMFVDAWPFSKKVLAGFSFLANLSMPLSCVLLEVTFRVDFSFTFLTEESSFYLFVHFTWK